jgi:hypothetical protein
MISCVLFFGLLMTLAGPVDVVSAVDDSTSTPSSGSARFGSIAHETEDDSSTPSYSEVVVRPNVEFLSDDHHPVPNARRMFRSGPSPHYHGAHHEPPPNYNFRDPDYYPNSGLGFPIRSSHGTWIGGRSGGRGWKHTGYHEKYRQGTFQWHW